MQSIDLRSDTVTSPDRGMIEAMAGAEVGDDVYGEDPTVNRLQDRVAEILGKEAALFVPTGVMSNQLCLKVLTSPGDEVIVGEESHIFNYETGAPALLSGVQLHTIRNEGGRITLEDIEQAVREDEYYLPRTSVIAFEQTHNRAGGLVTPIEEVESLSDFSRAYGIALHLDGARLWNAAIASGVSPREYASHVDTVSVCLSKGLGAPVGSLMAGTHEHVRMARKFRKIWGGGWRQAGFLAAAGLYALSNNVDSLASDHLKAREFAARLSSVPGIQILNDPETNIVLLAVDSVSAPEFAARVRDRGVLLSAAFKGKLRAVFHRDVSYEDALLAADEVASVASVLV